MKDRKLQFDRKNHVLYSKHGRKPDSSDLPQTAVC